MLEPSDRANPPAIELGLEGHWYVLRSDQRRWKEAQAALPKSWDLPSTTRMKSAESLTQFIQTVDRTCPSFGLKHSWAGLGEESEYLRPHVVRKISIKAAADTEVRCWGPLDRETLLLASPDRGCHLKEARTVVLVRCVCNLFYVAPLRIFFVLVPFCVGRIGNSTGAS